MDASAERLGRGAARSRRRRREARLGERRRRHGASHDGRASAGKRSPSPAARSSTSATSRSLSDEVLVLMAAGPGARSRHLSVDRRRRELEALSHEPREGRLLRRDRLLGREERHRRGRSGRREVPRAHDDRRRPQVVRPEGPGHAAGARGRGRVRGERHVSLRAPGRKRRLVRHRRREGLARLSHGRPRKDLDRRGNSRARGQRLLGSLLRRVSRRQARRGDRRRLQAAAVRRT